MGPASGVGPRSGISSELCLGSSTNLGVGRSVVVGPVIDGDIHWGPGTMNSVLGHAP